MKEDTAITATFECKGCGKQFQQSYQRSRHEKKCSILIEAKNKINFSLNNTEKEKDHLSQETLNHFSQPSTRSHTIQQIDTEIKKQTNIQEEIQFDFPDGNLTKPLSQDPSFKTKSSELGGALNSDQFNMNTLGENRELKKEVQMLHQQIKTLQQQQIKLEEKLELKDNELVKLNGDIFKLGGELSAANMLQKLLKEKEAENYQLKQEVTRLQKGSPINLHKQCEALELELRQQLKESEELSQATFDKLNQRIEELKDRLKQAEGKESESETDQAENKFRYVDEDMGNQQLDPIKQEQEQNNIDEIMIDTSLRPQQQQQKEKELKNSDELIDTTNRNYQPMASDKKEDEVFPKESHHHYKGEGYMQWIGGELVDVTASIQQNNLAKIKMAAYRYRCFTCEKLFSCEAGWIEHQQWMALNGRTCKCDVFQHGKYYHTIGMQAPYKRTIEKKELKKLETLIESTMNNPGLIQPEIHKTELNTRRDVQRDDSLEFIKSCKDQLAAVENWLLLLSQQCMKTELKAVDDPICDAIIYPRCSLVFGKDTKEHDRQLKVFLIDHGIPIRLVTNVATNNTATAFVYLMDSDNKFSPELAEKLGKSLDDLSNQVRMIVPPSELQQQIIEAELNNLYI